MLLLAFLTLAHFSVSEAFSIGHHADATTNAAGCVFGAEGSSATTQLLVLGSFFVEYAGVFAAPPRAEAPTWAAGIQKLHAHGLQNAQDVLGYLATVENGTLDVVDSELPANPIRALLAVGAGLHAIQDLYAHATWVELHARNTSSECTLCLRADTLGAYTQAQIEALGSALRTGNASQHLRNLPPAARIEGEWVLRNHPLEAHGDYCRGLNKDSANRPLFHEAYGFALAASIEFLERFIVTASEATAIAAEYVAMRDIAVPAAIPVAQDGHWKGSGSGDATHFASVEEPYFAADWLRFPRNAFAALASSQPFAAYLVNRLYSETRAWPASVGWPLTRQPFAALGATLTGCANPRAIVVRTLAANKIGAGSDAGSANKEDLFIRVRAPVTSTSTALHSFDEAPHLEADSVADIMWSTLVLVSGSGGSVPLQIQLYDDSGLLGNAAVLDIGTSGADKHVAITVDPATGTLAGDASGLHASQANPVAAVGANGAATFYVRALALGGCSGDGAVIVADAVTAQCPDADVETPVAFWCPTLPAAPTPPSPPSPPPPPCHVYTHRLLSKPYFVVGLQLIFSASVPFLLTYLKLTALERAVEAATRVPSLPSDDPPAYADVVMSTTSSYDSYSSEYEQQEEEASRRSPARPRSHSHSRPHPRSRSRSRSRSRARRKAQIDAVQIPLGARVGISYLIEFAQVVAQVTALIILYAAYNRESNTAAFQACSGFYQYEVAFVFLSQTSFLTHGAIVYQVFQVGSCRLLRLQPLRMLASSLFFVLLFTISVPWLVTHYLPATILYIPLVASAALVQIPVNLPAYYLHRRLARLATPHLREARRRTLTAVENMAVEIDFNVTVAAARALTLPITIILPGILLHFYHGSAWFQAVRDDYNDRDAAEYFASMREVLYVLVQALA
ncbi:uncharacterized protein AMSG_00548 [Thecamonas trahens ATCC 50062]|uniref:Uncharacterized protein n=1 Tax=Thecamonas trahens ATCC 50062 TaxID=461836 RepID=A0A0L0D9M4_THETB|nr:hypothetical protein AMSG_00548 [Thecamonas trahens ATCC 50062]KNC48771.1 hypothetical protein AMSG_00548 [Thecamonas trahens ATCC 50062]|eukprot:XP_013762822.1 hypothetical protein AMSG_00548 [Thecamonas trahens ATCC 50062]